MKAIEENRKNNKKLFDQKIDTKKDNTQIHCKTKATGRPARHFVRRFRKKLINNGCNHVSSISHYINEEEAKGLVHNLIPDFVRRENIFEIFGNFFIHFLFLNAF